MIAMTIDVRDPMVLGIKYEKLACPTEKYSLNFEAVILCYR